jgi:serine/threonine protein kinase/Leucine-rich repeat (LRR) protein
MDRCLTGADVLRYLGGQLLPDEFRQTDAHLASCSECSSRVAAVRLSSAGEALACAAAATQVGATSAMEGSGSSSAAPGSHWSDLAGQSSADFAPPPRPASLSLAEFLGTLSQSGLLLADDLAAVHEQASRPPTNTVVGLIDWLIGAQKLTRYQAELIVRGQTGGLVLGNYVILEKLGQGGMGTVFKARHRRMNRVVALKVLPAQLASIPEAVARFQREVEAVARLQHLNVAAAYDADEADGVHFLVMEHVDGPNLSAYVKIHGPLPLAAAVKLTAQAARGLAAAHDQGIVHRDIKPSNLMVNRHGVLKVLDMGLAQMRSEGLPQTDLTSDVTQTGRVMGTVDYMAPEQARDAKTVDFRADLYSLGCTLFFLATGRTPAPGISAAEKLLWHQTQYVTPLSVLAPTSPPRLDGLLQRLMAKRPEDRPASMKEVAAELEACLAELPAGEADLAIGEIAISVESPGSTLGASRFGQKTLIHGAPTLSRAESLNIPVAKPKSRLWMYACGLAGAAALAAITLGPMLAKKPDVVVLVPAQPGTFSHHASQAGSGLPVPSQPGLSQPGPGQTSPVQSGTTSPPPTATGLPPAVPISPHAPYEKLLAWVFANGGQVTAVGGKGQERTLSEIAQLPAEPLAILKIRLDGTGVRDGELAALSAAPGLRELSLADTRLSDAALPHLERLPQLTHLNLRQTAITSGGLAALARLPALVDLDLAKTQVTDQGLARLAALHRLEHLNLADNDLTDAGIQQLHGLKSLREVKLNGTALSAEGHAALAAALPDAKIAWDGIDEERAVAVRLLDKGAIVAVLDRRQQMHAGIRSADDLPPGRLHVKRIELGAGASFGDDDLKELVKLPEIETLSLAGVAVTPAGLTTLYGLKSLKTLDLGALRLPPAALTALQTALGDCQILIKEPADLGVARLVLGLKGRVGIVTERGVVHGDIASETDLPAGAWQVRSIRLDGLAAANDAALAQFGELSRLESLFLSGTPLTDEGVAQLAACKSLRELSLSQTKISAAAIGALTRLPVLARLYLADTAIGSEGARQAATLPNLTHLSLQGVTLADDDLALLKRCERLEWLDLSATPISDAALIHLSQLGTLRELHIAGTGVSDAGQEELQAALASCRVLGDPLDLQRLAARWLLDQKAAVALDGGPLTNLKGLPRSGCRVLVVDLAEIGTLNPAEAVKHLSACTELVSLNLSDTPLTAADLAFLQAMPELRELRLANLPFGDATLKLLAEHSKLEILDLSGTRVTGAGLESLERAAELKQLFLGNTPLDERLLASLVALQKLETLDLSACRELGDGSLSLIETLPSLRSLGFRGTRLSDAACERLAKLPDLEQLDISSTKVTDGGVAALASLKKLRQIGLARTAVSDAATGSLSQMKSLKRIDLAGNKMSAEAIRTLRAALPGCYVTEPAQAPMGDRLSPLPPRE